MKKIHLLFILFLCTISLFAQTPQKMSYQAIIRNSSDNIIANQSIGIQISIIQTNPASTAVYVETQTPTTNANGLISIEIGTGSVVSGDFTTIDWSNDTYFIKTEVDTAGGTNYTITGTSQLMSVPYALHAKTAETVASITETDPIFGASVANGITNTDITNWNNKLSAEVDGSITNEIELPTGGADGQVLKTDGSGNYAWVNQTTDTNTQLNEAAVDGFVANNGYLTTEVDGSITNEIELPTGGTDGQVLKTDGSGNYAWVNQTTDTNTQLNEAAVDGFVANNGYLTTEVDGSITNEIELPTGGTDGQVLKTDGSGNYAWIDQTTSTSIIDNLTSTSTTAALSAAQGKALEDTKLNKSLADASIFIGNASNSATAQAISGDATLTNDGTLTIADDAVDGTDISLTGEVAGDMTYFNGTDWVRLPKGTANQSLVMNSGATAPEWQSGGATEDVETVLGTATGGNGTTITIPANISDYQYLRLESDDWTIASNPHSVRGTALVSNMASKRILIYADGTDYLHADINASLTSLQIHCTGTANWRLVGIKAQKIVVNPADATVIDDDTFATASSSNVPSAESVKALMDNTVQAMVEHPSLEIRYIDIGDIRIQWGHLTVTGSATLNIYAMSTNITSSSLTANVLATQGDTNVYVVNGNVVDYNTITFNAFVNGAPTTATIKWMLIGPKP